ncbi:MAG: response regulator [Pseudobacteriovorax sp.]|nr:response regulator [Pseudobacteriovorax sp.]
MENPSVLVVDDDPDIRIYFEEALVEAGYDVFETIDGLDTIDILKTIEPDVMLLDLSMPNMDGFEFLEHVRDEGIDLPILVVSGLQEEGIAQRVLELGANGFRSKPVKPSVLLEDIRQLLADVNGILPLAR